MTSERKVGIITFVSLIALIAQMFLYRKTFINFWIPFSIFLVGGFVLFTLFRKRFQYYIETKHAFYLQVFHGTIMFGGILVFTFMGLNYYLPTDKDHEVEMRVLHTDYLSAGRRGGCGNPYAIVHYNGMEKQLVFPCNTNLIQGQNIKVSLNKGLFGFLIVEEMTSLVTQEDLDQLQIKEETDQYHKILDAAESNLQKGDTAKAIEYFQRAVGFKPSHKATKKRLEEISGK